MTNAWAMIHRETGEIKEIESNANRNAGYKQKLAKEQREGRAHDFTNANMTYIHEVYNVLTTAQCGYLMLLQCYVGWSNGIILNTDNSQCLRINVLSVLTTFLYARSYAHASNVVSMHAYVK